MSLKEAYLRSLTPRARRSRSRLREEPKVAIRDHLERDLDVPVTELSKYVKPTALQIVAGALAEVFRKSVFEDEFKDGIRVMTAVEIPLRLDAARKVVPPGLLEYVKLDYDKGSAKGPGLQLAFIDAHDKDDPFLLTLRPHQQPMESVPDQRIRPNFSRFEFLAQQLRFGPVQANILGQLFDAHQAGNPWISSSELLENAGSNSVRISDVFKSKKRSLWRQLIESDGRGQYRWKGW